MSEMENKVIGCEWGWREVDGSMRREEKVGKGYLREWENEWVRVLVFNFSFILEVFGEI